MEEQTRAPLNSQLGHEPCMVEDTGEMFWLRNRMIIRVAFSLAMHLLSNTAFGKRCKPINMLLVFARTTGSCFTAWPEPI